VKAGYPANPLDDEVSEVALPPFLVPMTRLARYSVEGFLFFFLFFFCWFGGVLSPRTPARARTSLPSALSTALRTTATAPDGALDHLVRKKQHSRRQPGGVARAALTKFATLTDGVSSKHYQVPKAISPPGILPQDHRQRAAAWGLITAAKRRQALFFSGYPITPASSILH